MIFLQGGPKFEVTPLALSETLNAEKKLNRDKYTA